MDRDLEGCAYVLLTMHRIFGVKSMIAHLDKNSLTIHASKCQWQGKVERWNVRTCLSIDHYEAGLIEGVLPHSKHNYTKRRSCGGDVCELVIKL
jgi:hypothetical protein